MYFILVLIFFIVIDSIMVLWAKIMKKTTNFMINAAMFDDLIKNNKKFIIIFGHPKCKPCQKIMCRLPIVMIKALLNWYTLKFCNVLENSAKCKEMWINHTPTLYVYENAKLVLKIEDETKFFEFLKTFKK